jgi:CHAT domain-containing protein/signal recognition particle subunit SEC65
MNMSEQRVEACINLIQQLLGCESGAEGAILQQHTELVDAGLVEVMKQYADLMESQGDGKAGWLRQFSGQLAQMLGQPEAAQDVGQDRVYFAVEMIELIAQTKGDRNQIYAFFRANLTQLDSELLAALPVVSNLLSNGQPGVEKFLAAAFAEFGSSIQQFPLGNRELNLELGIAAFQLALQVYTHEALSQHWAIIQYKLANAYHDRIRGDRADNLELAITAFRLALQVYTCEAFPEDWATTQNHLIIMYNNRIRGDRAENIEQAIVAAQLALRIRTRKAFPEQWAMTQHNLANAYLDRIQGDRAENLELAITAYQHALQVYTREAFPKQWAVTQYNLAAAYSERIQGDRADNIEETITIFQLALQVYTRESFPQDWARTQYNLATVYNNRIRGNHSDNLKQAIAAAQLALLVYNYEAFPQQWAATQYTLALAYSNLIRDDCAENLEQAIAAYQLALRVYTRETFPQQWAMTQYNLAFVYRERIRGDRAENLEQAIVAAQLTLQVYTREVLPQNWAMSQNNLAAAYHNRILGNRADNLEQAIETFQLVLQVYTREAFPQDWAMVQSNLATAYRERIRGDRADNLEQAIAAAQLALQVRTREAFPQDWAMTQNNLAATYRDRIRGDRADNLEQAVDAARLALQVRTREAFPQDWAMTQNNLANAYRERVRGKRAENLEEAIAVFRLALEVYTREAFPEKWAVTQNNLAISYHDRIRGDRAENLEEAIAAYHLALQVYTRKGFPQQWAMTQNNMATVYRERIRGDRAENIEQAISSCQLALQVYTSEAFPQKWAMTQGNLATAYYDRIRGDRAENIEQAISSCQLALQVYTPEAFPDDCRSVARLLGNLYFEQQAWHLAATTYDTALTAAEIVYQNCLFLEGQASVLSKTGDLHHRATYAHAKNGNIPIALLTLELGRARGLSDSLARDRANLDQLQTIRPDLFAQYQTLTQEIRNLEIQQRNPDTNQPDQLRQALVKTRQSLTETIATIQQIEGYETFLKAPTFEDITRALKPDQAIVYITTTPAGSLALILTPNTEIHPVWIDELNQEQSRELVNDWFSAYNKQQSDRQTWFNMIDQTTQILWDKVMGLIVQKLTELHLPQAVLIPTGYLGLLPLHAAWTADDTTPTDKRYALDTIHFTYAPNARSLREARELGDRIPADSILAIDEPKHRYEDPENPETYRDVSKLPNSSREIEAAIATFLTPQVLRHEQATRSAVLAQLPHINVLHCSCHGNANLQEPLKSGLALTGDGESAVLTLRDILDLKLSESTNGGIRLTILSACETGLSGIEAIDEVISLPTGLLQAGVAGVAASLWSVSELSTMLLLVKFYDYWRNDNLDPSIALRQAQQWLRDTTNDEKISYFKTFLPESSTTKMPTTTADYLFKALRLDDLGDRAFAHPFHWAAFQYVGV